MLFKDENAANYSSGGLCPIAAFVVLRAPDQSLAF